MGRKAILVVCWLAFSQAFGDQGTVKPSAAVKDNESAPSAPRLYRNVPLGVYASAAPYAAYSFHLPQFIAAPKTAASQVTPVKQKPVNQNINTYLMDSYGNRFMETPQLASYKSAFPQQYVALQTKLPEHLAQPLVAASPNFQFKQSGPQVFFGAPYRVPALESPSPTPLHHFPSFGQHLVYAEKVQSLASPVNIHNHVFGTPSAQQQPSNNKAVFASAQSHNEYNNFQNEPKFQRQQDLPQIIVGKPKFQNIQDTPHGSHGEAKFQRNQDSSSVNHGEYQRIQELPHANRGERKFQQVQDISHAPHEGVQFQRIQEIPHVAHGETKFQRLQESPQIIHVEHSYERAQEAPEYQEEQSHSNNKAQIQEAPGKQTTFTYINDVNGKKSVVKVKTDPVPLLDLTLLEPLTFDNPLVPQVQHFLPRISQATYQKLPDVNIDGVKNYQKEFVMKKTMSYDSGHIRQKPQNAPKKKQKKPTQTTKHTKKNDVPKKTYHETLDDAPEISYEINIPGHKEIYSEKAVSYNKETQSEPVHYSYGSKSEKEPVTYSYSRTSKDPAQLKAVHYHGNGPSQLIYHFKPEEQNHEQTHSSAPHRESENIKDSSQESENEGPPYHHYHSEQYKKHPKSSEEHHELAREEQEHEHSSNQENQHRPNQENQHRSNQENQHRPNHENQHRPNQEIQHRPNQENQHESLHVDPAKHYAAQKQQHTGHQIELEPSAKEFEEDIRLMANAQIKVDPSQHLHTSQQDAPPPQHSEQTHAPQRHQQSAPQTQPHPTPESHSHPHYYAPHSELHNAPAAHIQEKSKRVIIHEETPDERHMLTEQMKAEVIKQEENNEEDFEKGYKDAAIGFPAYSKEALEAAEKDIFDPETYGVPPDHVEYDIEHTPFQQYQDESDDYPKETRANYKDARDKMKEDYYLDYSVSKPESLLDRYQNKLGYYKLYKQQKPDFYVPEEEEEEDDNKKKQKPKFAKYTAAPTFNYSPSKEQKSKSYYGHHKPNQQLYEYDYSKGTPRDSSAFASRPYQRYKTKTNFVEPQFQYGFEPISIPKLLDSELAAMASNNSPESEKPGMRKKVYKENWYIKKTSTSGGAPSS